MKNAIFVLFFSSLATSAFAFVAEITTECIEGYILVSVSVVDPTPPLYPHPDAYGGYTVVRYALGTCEDPVMLTEYSIDFTEGFEIADNPNSLGTPYIYAIQAVDLLGNLYNPSGVENHYVSVSCSGRPIFKGTLVGINYVGVIVEPCPNSCWLPEWMINSRAVVANGYQIPFLDYLGTGIPISLYGEISYHWEMGNNIWVETLEPTSCGPVSVEKQSWSRVKAQYR